MIAVVEPLGTTTLPGPAEARRLSGAGAPTAASDARSIHGDRGPGSLALGGLLARARQGDRAALEGLWEANRRWVAVVLLAHKPAEVDLDDLLQDVAVTLVTRLGDVREDEGFRGWLRMVAVNAARAAARSAGIRRMRPLDASEESEPSHGPRAPSAGEGTPVREDARRLLDLAMHLGEDYREPLLLKSLHALSYRQIGVLLDLPETTVETRITRARKRLRELAEERAPSPASSRLTSSTPGSPPAAPSAASPASRSSHANASTPNERVTS